MTREQLNGGRIDRPFFKQLRRRLDEIGLQIAGGKLRAPTKNPVKQMPVFMEEGNDILTFHEAGLISFRLREVADENVFRNSYSLLAGREIKRSVVLVLILAGEHVEVNASEQLISVEDVVDLNVGMPDLGFVYLLVCDSVKLAGEVENASLHARVLEIGPNDLRVVTVVLTNSKVREMSEIPGANRCGVGILALLQREQGLIIAVSARLSHRGNFVDEVSCILLGAHHLVFCGVGGPIRVAERGSQLMALLQHVRQHIDVLRI